MKVTPLICLSLIQGALSHVLQERACAADNCARAVTGTASFKDPVSQRRADCSSFQQVTVTPATVTVTQTTTVTSAPMRKRDAAIAARQVTVVPSAVPSYASACSGSVRYASACSCWGITRNTITVATPSTTTTVTTTVTPPPPTTSCSNPGNCGTYVQYPCGTGACACGKDADGKAVCFTPAGCAIPCTANSDCPSDRVCLVGSCCGTGSCVLTLAGVCPNTVAARAVFGAVPAKARRGDCNELNCSQ